jgi:hypothetical protein
MPDATQTYYPLSTHAANNDDFPYDDVGNIDYIPTSVPNSNDYESNFHTLHEDDDVKYEDNWANQDDWSNPMWDNYAGWVASRGTTTPTHTPQSPLFGNTDDIAYSYFDDVTSQTDPMWGNPDGSIVTSTITTPQAPSFILHTHVLTTIRLPIGTGWGMLRMQMMI